MSLAVMSYSLAMQSPRPTASPKPARPVKHSGPAPRPVRPTVNAAPPAGAPQEEDAERWDGMS